MSQPAADPIRLLERRLSEAIEGALGPRYAGSDPVLRRASPQRGDYQSNAALGFAKAEKSSPELIASAIVDHLDASGLLDAVAVDRGFINLRLRSSVLASTLDERSRDPRLGAIRVASPQRVVIDYSAPNIAKEMHVGHLRSTIIGDALARILEFLGHDVIRQNHLGDWGTPFGMLIEHLIDLGEDEATHELSMGELTAFYQSARSKFDDSEAFQRRAQHRVVMLQRGDVETLRLWAILVGESKRYFNAIYDKLDVTLDDSDDAGESSYNDSLSEVCAELEASGIARLSEGALCAFAPGFTNRDGGPLPLILRNSVGGYGYATTDLAALRYRTQRLAANRIIYVVGAPQSQHLSMVFAVGKLAGWLAPDKAMAQHVSFGSVLGSDHKVLRTRAGATVKLVDLIDAATTRAEAEVEARNRDLDATEVDVLAAAIGVGSIKFADLSNDRIKDYVFELEQMVSFDGKTAGYIQYAHTRGCAILRRAADSGQPNEAVIAIDTVEERSLALLLLGFPDILHAVDCTAEPHRLCLYLYDLAAAFTAFYEACPVLSSTTDSATRISRLAITGVTQRTLEVGLNLLGIAAPARM